MSFWRDYIKPLGNQDGHGKYTINEIADKLRQKGVPLKDISSNLADDYKISISTAFLSFFEAGTLIEFVFYGYFSKVKFGGRTYEHLSQAQDPTTKQWSSSFTFLATPGDLSLNWRELNLCWEPAQEVTSLFLKNEDYFLKTAFTINSASSGYSTTDVNGIGLIPSNAATDGLNDAGITDLHKKTAAYLVDKKYNINGLAPDNAQPSDNSFSYKTNGAECFGFMQEPEIIADNWDSTDDFIVPSELAENEAIVAYVQESADYSDCNFSNMDPSSFCSWDVWSWPSQQPGQTVTLRFITSLQTQRCQGNLKKFKIYDLSNIDFNESSSFSNIKSYCTPEREVSENNLFFPKYNSIIDKKQRNVLDISIPLSFVLNPDISWYGGASDFPTDVLKSSLSRLTMKITLSGETINRSQLLNYTSIGIQNNETQLVDTRWHPVSNYWSCFTYVIQDYTLISVPPGTLHGFLPFFKTESYQKPFIALLAQYSADLKEKTIQTHLIGDGDWNLINQWTFNTDPFTFPYGSTNIGLALSIGAALAHIDKESTSEDLFEKTYHIVVVHFKNTHKQI